MTDFGVNSKERNGFIMVTRKDWACFFSLMLAAALFGFCQRPRATAVPHLAGPADPAPLQRIIFIGFTQEEEMELRAALRYKFTRRCAETFATARLRSPAQVVSESGIVIQHSRHLYLYNSRALGLLRNNIRDTYKSEFSSGRAQAGTVPGARSGQWLTVDGKSRIYVHDSAFLGESFLFGRLSLDDVLTHELIHAGGQPPTPGWLGFLRHDLAGFKHYNKIMEACR